MDKEEAMKKLKDFHDKSALFSVRTALETLHPELKESEDEMIRKALKEYFINSFQNNGVAAICGVHIKDILAWLEKQGTSYTKRDVDDAFVEGMVFAKNELEKQSEQKLPIEKLPEEMKTIGESLGFTTQEECDEYNQIVSDCIMSDTDKSEQKPTDNDMKKALCTEYEKGRADAFAQMQKEWSEEDKDFMYDTLSNLTELKDRYGEGYGNVGRCIDWVKDLKNRVQPQPKQEWSEEDEAGLGDAMWAIEQARTIAKDENDMGNVRYAEHWLKSLKERCTWKPSDKQMRALEYIINNAHNTSYSCKIAKELLEQLKKLKGE